MEHPNSSSGSRNVVESTNNNNDRDDPMEIDNEEVSVAVVAHHQQQQSTPVTTTTTTTGTATTNTKNSNTGNDDNTASVVPDVAVVNESSSTSNKTAQQLPPIVVGETTMDVVGVHSSMTIGRNPNNDISTTSTSTTIETTNSNTIGVSRISTSTLSNDNNKKCDHPAITTTTRTTTGITTTPSNNWENICERLVMTNNVNDIYILFNQFCTIYDTSIKSLHFTHTSSSTSSIITTTTTHNYHDIYRNCLYTIIPICSTIIQQKTIPQQQQHDNNNNTASINIQYQLRYKIVVDFLYHSIVQYHINKGSSTTTTTTTTGGGGGGGGTLSSSTTTTTSTTNSSSLFVLRNHPNLLHMIIGIMIHVIQTDYEIISVQALHCIFDIYKYYRTTTISASSSTIGATTSNVDYIQQFLDFVIALYKNVPTMIQENFLPHNLLLQNNNDVNTDDTAILAMDTTNTATDTPMTITEKSLSVLTTSSNDVVTATPTTTPMEITTTTTTTTTADVDTTGTNKPSNVTTTPMDVSTTTPTTTTATKEQQKVIDIIDQTFDIVLAPTGDGGVNTSADGIINAQAKQQELKTDGTAKNYSPEITTPHSSSTTTVTTMSPPRNTNIEHTSSGGGGSSSSSSPTAGGIIIPPVQYKSTMSFQVLTECPLIVMLLLFQLYSQTYIKSNISTFISIMMDTLSLRPPSFNNVINRMNKNGTSNATAADSSNNINKGVEAPTSSSHNNPIDVNSKKRYEQIYMIRVRELIAAQAKTLSFLTYLLRTYVNELKPYEETLATNVITLMSICPRDVISTRKELLVATRHILNSEFRTGFFRHIDSMIDERTLMGGTTSISTSYHRPDPMIIRPLAYTTLADFIQHTRTMMSMPQMSKVVCLFSRVIHDTSTKLPLATQFTAVRTLVSLIDIIYHNKDVENPQLGRDILVRLFSTLVDKLSSLYDEYYDQVMGLPNKNETDRDLTATLQEGMDTVERTKWLYEINPITSTTTTDTIREVQSLIRTIIVSQKNIVYYLCNYRNQRLEYATASASNESTTTVTPPNNVTTTRGDATAATTSASNLPGTTNHFMPPLGSNEEVASALLKLTHTEIALIDKYILIAIPCMRLLKRQQDLSDNMKNDTNNTTSPMIQRTLTSNSENAGVNAQHNTEKSGSEWHHESITYFAATFTCLDGYNLRRSIGSRMDVLVDAIIEEPLLMIVPRHLIGSNATTSYEFCTLLLDYLVDRMDLLGHPNRIDFIFVNEQTGNEITEQEYLREIIHTRTQRPFDSNKRHRHRTAIYIQLFERVLKSLSVYPDNEVLVRKHLKRMVTACLRSSFENTTQWPESYATLLRYIFRSISAGKFEESYRELLPLLPTILNGLYRVITFEDSVLRSTAIELCLTIPARLSSLLPHMNLLLRIIIPALDSNSNELVHLGLRTLEFWVDNLNHLLLYPEISKRSTLFTSLMQALSRHLRPAPYQYGLLTLRLLGKLGGKNRQFLRDPMPLQLKTSNDKENFYISLNYNAMQKRDAMDELHDKCESLQVPVPLHFCVDILRDITVANALFDVPDQDHSVEIENVTNSVDQSALWSCKIEDLDVQSYSRCVINTTKQDQAIACMNVLRAALEECIPTSSCDDMDIDLPSSKNRSFEKLVCTGLLYACIADPIKAEAMTVIRENLIKFDRFIFAECFASFLSEPSTRATKVGLDILEFIVSRNIETESCDLNQVLDAIMRSICETCCASTWARQHGLMEAIEKLVAAMGGEWSISYEVNLVNATLLAIKSQPRELSEVAIRSLKCFILVCTTLYGENWNRTNNDDDFVWDILSVEGSQPKKEAENEVVNNNRRPSEDVFKIIIYDMTSPLHLVRFASRFLLSYFVCGESKEHSKFVTDRIDLIRRVLFSRTLRLLPLSHQVGAVEGLATIVKLFPNLFPITDQHVLTFLSELLKMASVADGEMTDKKLNDIIVDKDGFVPNDVASERIHNALHTTSIFFRRECVITFSRGVLIVIPCELPTGVQFRVGSIMLLHSIIKHYSNAFFDADSTTPIGNIRPHVISLLFRTLTSHPLRAVNASHFALRDVLALSSSKPSEGEEILSSNSRIPKELLQTCIRPVLLQLREYTRLGIPLLRGLSRLLLLLGSWFNKTLGEKLLEHLRKWTDPSVIISHKIWLEGEEPLVAAAIIDIFSLLPYASQFVEHLVKTCIKLESTLHLYKANVVESPYRRPLARYLNKHAQFAVSFFFPRFKTPMYSELFQYIVKLDESTILREHLCTKQCSDLLLHVCFERPLAIIRAEKSSSGDAKSSLSIHGIGKQNTSETDQGSGTLRPMNIEALEMQHQGLRLVETLMANNVNFFKDHSDILRATRWMWRSRGRLLRQQYEEAVPPRYHDESKLLAIFRINYAKSLPEEAIDILFELFRVFLQPSTIDFGFVSRFLVRIVTEVLSIEQKQKVLSRFFTSITGDTNEEIKVLGIQFLIIPMISSERKGRMLKLVHSQILNNESIVVDEELAVNIPPKLIDSSVLQTFIVEVIHQDGHPISCGSKLTVELLRLLNHFVGNNATEVETYQNDIVQFCWGIAKSENMTCRCWSYVVLCQLIATFDAPSKLVRRVYFALLKINEERKLVRVALDILVPVLSRRLDENTFLHTIDETIGLLAEEGISVSSFAQICQTIVRNPDIFESNWSRIVPHFVTGVNRLGLQSNGTLDNRFLALNVVELTIAWLEKYDCQMKSQFTSSADVLSNFLVRLKLMISEIPVDIRSTSHFDTFVHVLDAKLQSLLDTVMSKYDVKLRISPFEKLLTRERKLSGSLLASLEIFAKITTFQCRTFLHQNASVVRDIIDVSIEHSRQDTVLQHALRHFAISAKSERFISSFILTSFDRVLLHIHMTKSLVSERTIDRSRITERTSRSNDLPDSSAYTLFALEIVAELCRDSVGLVHLVGSTLVTITKFLAKLHISDAAAKLRQSASTTSRSSASCIKYSTPTIGILKESIYHEKNSAVRVAKGRSGKELTAMDSQVRSLVVLLSIFECAEVIYMYNDIRKDLLQIISNIIEASDNVQVILIAVRCVGKWMLSKSPSCPLTCIEQLRFLERLCAFDSGNLTDDVVAQMLSDLISEIALQLKIFSRASNEKLGYRLLVACSLSANTPTRRKILDVLKSNISETIADTSLSQILLLICQVDFEGLSERFWITAFVDILLHFFSVARDNLTIQSLSTLSHGNTSFSVVLLETLLPWIWSKSLHDGSRLHLVSLFERLLAQPFHSQFIRTRCEIEGARCLNSIRPLLSVITSLNPIPVLDTSLLIYLAENYNCWYEALAHLESQYPCFKQDKRGEIIVSAMRHCYMQLGEDDMWCSLAKESCVLTETETALSLDMYDIIGEAAKQYSELMQELDCEVDPTDFEMDLWEERWILLQKELCQFQVVSEFANASDCAILKMECAWKAQDWQKLRNLCSSPELLASLERGNPTVKMMDTLLAFADGKFSDVENLHAQSAQLCLYKWQLLPQLSSGSFSHLSLLHFFHRLVEIRESALIIVEPNSHSIGKTLPELKKLLSDWRQRLPNEWEKLSKWDDVFVWRAHMFGTLSSNFPSVDAETLTAHNDQPWTALRLAKTARKQGLRDVTLLLLSKVTDDSAMSVPDAYTKLRERILAMYNLELDDQAKLERQSGRSLINATNLSFFDSSQNSELFRLRALFLQSLQGRSKANQAFCHSVQICPTHARAWDSWGELCASLGTATEKQIEQSSGLSDNNEANKEAAKKVRQYLAQAMGCFIEAIQIDGHEWARLRIPKCLWMLTKDGSTPGVLCQTLENRGAHLPPWVWLPWIPQLLTSLYRKEGQQVKTIFARLVKSYPQAVYYALRTFYLERRDVDRGRSTSTTVTSEHLTSVVHAEELMSLLRRTHASLWSALEPILEEIIVKFRHSYEEELLATIVVLLERTETQFGNVGKKDDDAAVAASVWKTLGKIAVKFFRHHEHDSTTKDARAEKTARFKDSFKGAFESDFHVSSVDATSSGQDQACPIGLDEVLLRLRSWKRRLEDHVLASPESVSLVECSHSLAMYGFGDIPDLWPGSCDPRLYSNERENSFDTEVSALHSSTSSSFAVARKSANNAADLVAGAARREGVGGYYGGGSSVIEIPGQYVPNTFEWRDGKPSPELHVKLLKFEPTVAILRRNDALVRRVGMVGSDGNTYYFLLQIGVSYLARTDERSSQTAYVLDKILRKDMKSSRALLSVQSFPAIPVAQRLRLIYEPEGRSSLEDAYKIFCQKKGIHHSDATSFFCDDVKKRLAERVSIMAAAEGKNLVELEKETRVHVFKSIRASDRRIDTLLSDHAKASLIGAEMFYQFRRKISQQWAANCLLQYTFSAMDRNPSKVVFDYCNGRVYAHEFRLAYTNQGILESQHVPFRLTPNLETLIGFPHLDAKYTVSMALIAGAVHQYQHDLDPILRLLMRDDLIAYFTKSLAKSDSTTVEMEKQLAGSVARNVALIHSRFSECSPSLKSVLTKQQIRVDQRVRDLIDTARNPESLCLMPGSYQGWL